MHVHIYVFTSYLPKSHLCFLREFQEYEVAEVKVMAHESTGVSHTCIADWVLFCYGVVSYSARGKPGWV